LAGEIIVDGMAQLIAATPAAPESKEE